MLFYICTAGRPPAAPSCRRGGAMAIVIVIITTTTTTTIIIIIVFIITIIRQLSGHLDPPIAHSLWPKGGDSPLRET